MANLRKILAAILIVVFFTILLICRGLGLHTFMVPFDTRVIFIVELLLALVAMTTFFFFCLKHYSTSSNAQEGDDEPRQRRNIFTVYLFKVASARSTTNILTQNATVIAIYIFGAGSIALNASYIYYKAQCLYFYKEAATHQNESFFAMLTGSPSNQFKYTDAQFCLLTSVLKVFLIIVEIPFLHCLSKLTYAKRKSTVASAALVIIIGVDAAKWLFSFLNETAVFNIFPNKFPKESNTHDLRTACLNHSSIAEVYSHTTMDDAFWPFYIQFCFVSLEILYRVYVIDVINREDMSEENPSQSTQDDVIQKAEALCNTQNLCLIPRSIEIHTDISESIDPWKEIFSSELPDDEDNETSPLLDSAHSAPLTRQLRSPINRAESDTQALKIELVKSGTEPLSPRQSMCAKAWSRTISFWCPITALIVGVIEALLIKYFLMHKDLISDGYITEDYLDTYCALPLISFCIILDGIPLLMITVHCCYILTRFPHKRNTPAQMRVTIILALMGIFILNAFKVIVSIIKLSHPEDLHSHDSSVWSLTLIEAVVFWPQYYLQIVVIYLGQQRLPDPSHTLYNTLDGAFAYLAMNNFMHWGISSFLESDYSISRIDDIQEWSTLVHLVTPIYIYFYFFCTFMLLDIKADLKDARIPPQKWRLVMKVASLRPHAR